MNRIFFYHPLPDHHYSEFITTPHVETIRPAACGGSAITYIRICGPRVPAVNLGLLKCADHCDALVHQGLMDAWWMQSSLEGGQIKESRICITLMGGQLYFHWQLQHLSLHGHCNLWNPFEHEVCTAWSDDGEDVHQRRLEQWLLTVTELTCCWQALRYSCCMWNTVSVVLQPSLSKYISCLTSVMELSPVLNSVWYQFWEKHKNSENIRRNSVSNSNVSNLGERGKMLMFAFCPSIVRIIFHVTNDNNILGPAMQRTQ